MGLSFMSNENYYPNLKVLNGGLENTFSDVDDIVNYFKQQRREIAEKIEHLENDMSFEAQREIAVLIRNMQYLDVLLDKNKSELEKIFFPNGNGNCVIPDVFQWYQGSNS